MLVTVDSISPIRSEGGWGLVTVTVRWKGQNTPGFVDVRAVVPLRYESDWTLDRIAKEVKNTALEAFQKASSGLAQAGELSYELPLIEDQIDA